MDGVRSQSSLEDEKNAFVAQLVERSLGKTEVSGSIPDEGSRGRSASYTISLSTCQVTQVANEGSL